MKYNLTKKPGFVLTNWSFILNNLLFLFSDASDLFKKALKDRKFVLFSFFSFSKYLTLVFIAIFLLNTFLFAYLVCTFSPYVTSACIQIFFLETIYLVLTFYLGLFFHSFIPSFLNCSFWNYLQGPQVFLLTWTVR